MNKYLRTTNEEPHGHFFIRMNGKTFLTKLAMVVAMLGLIDIVFGVQNEAHRSHNRTRIEQYNWQYDGNSPTFPAG